MIRIIDKHKINDNCNGFFPVSNSNNAQPVFENNSNGSTTHVYTVTARARLALYRRLKSKTLRQTAPEMPALTSDTLSNMAATMPQ